MSKLSVNHLLGIRYLTKEDINLIFETADHFKEVINRPIKKVPSLRDITIANLFFENSMCKSVHCCCKYIGRISRMSRKEDSKLRLYFCY